MDKQGESKTVKGRSLYLEFSVYISGIAVIFIMLTVSFNLKREVRLLDENRNERVSILLATFSKLTAKAAGRDDLQLILLAAGEIVSDPEIGYFAYYDADGRCVLSTRAALQGETPSDEISRKALASAEPKLLQSYTDPDTQTPMLDVSAPVMSGDTRVGTVRFGFDSTRHNARLSKMRFEYAGLSFVSILMAILISFVLARRTMAPIRLLKEKLDALVQGESIETVRIDSADEIQQLADSFNAMTAKWQQMYEELRQAFEELKGLDRMKDQFVSLVSHELRTPLSSIVAAAEVLSEHDMLSEEETKEFISIINIEGKRLTKLVSDILDLAKMKAGKEGYHFREGNVNHAVTQAAKVAEFAAETKGQTLKVELEDNLPPARFDFDRIVQVVSNLLGNAVRYTPAEGEITARTAKKDGGVLISIADNGQGISPEDQERIFREFEQAGDADSQTGGTGLGLAICKRLVEAHNGRIWVESRGTGKGATFFVQLPLDPENSVERQEQANDRA
ncbi:MAG: HAMP domain-containing protein [Planctomycetes bacterium]|nr:HAMP domain-containing protein [Planctomycetota bacterium]